MTEYRIVYKTRFLYDSTRFSLGLDSINFEMFVENRKLSVLEGNNVVINESNVQGKPCIDREIKSLDLTNILYIYYDEHEAPSSCNITVYFSLHATKQTETIIQTALKNYHQFRSVRTEALRWLQTDKNAGKKLKVDTELKKRYQ